ncbi:MAG: reverse transcriptase domain-containing protein [Candidatus Aenigmatarchaeota archaeon]|mgnify:FL=1
MKTYPYLFEKLCSLENLKLAFKKAKKGKNRKWYVREFESSLDSELAKLKTEFETQTYKPKPLRRFVIRDPKTRVIHASAFRHRVVHHAICNIIEPIFEKVFIHDTYANRKNKGTHAGLKRFDEFKRKIANNGQLVKNAKDNNMVTGYALKADIKHYFDTIDLEILMKIIGKKITDEKVLQVIKTILDNHDFKIKGKGMPLGNLTSQFFANVYLSELDYYIKHNLKAKYYIRYVDDFIILHTSKEKLLLYKWVISNFLKQRLRLELHPEKTKIMLLHNGVNLLGFRVFYHYKLPRKSNLRKFEMKLNNLYTLTTRENNKIDNINKMLEGWFGYAMHGNTYKMRKIIMKKYIYSNLSVFKCI